LTLIIVCPNVTRAQSPPVKPPRAEGPANAKKTGRSDTTLNEGKPAKPLNGGKSDTGQNEANSATPLSAEQLYKEAEEAFSKNDISLAINKAVEAIGKAEKDSGADSRIYAYIGVNLAQLYVDISQPMKGLRYAEKACANYEGIAGRENADYAGACITLGSIYLQLTRYADADSVLRTSLRVFEKKDSSEEYLAVLNSYGTLYQMTGEPAKAEAALEKALNYYLKYFPDRPGEYVVIMSNLAYVCATLGNPAKALNLYGRIGALYATKVSIENTGYFEYLDNYAQLCTDRGRYDSASILFGKAEEYIRTRMGKANMQYAMATNGLGWSYYKQWKLGQAMAAYGEALGALRQLRGEGEVFYARTLTNEALVYALVNNGGRADSLFKEAADVFRRIEGVHSVDYMKTTQNLAHLRAIQGRLNQSLDYYDSSTDELIGYIRRNFYGLSAEGKMDLYRTVAGAFQFLPSVIHVHIHHADSSRLAERIFEEQVFLNKMVLFSTRALIDSIRVQNDPLLLKTLDSWSRHKTALSAVYYHTRNGGASAATDSLAALIEKEEKELSLRSRTFQGDGFTTTQTAAQFLQKLPAGSALVKFIRYQLFDYRQTDSIYYAALILAPGRTAPVCVDLCAEARLRTVLEDPAGIYYDPKHAVTVRSRSAAIALNRLVWAPLEKYIGNAHTIYILSDGLLNRIAFGAISDGTSGTPKTHGTPRTPGTRGTTETRGMHGTPGLLRDKYAVHMLGSLRSLEGEKENLPLRRLEIWGDMDYDRGAGPGRSVVSGGGVGPSAARGPDSSRGGLPARWGALPNSRKEVQGVVAAAESKGLVVRSFTGENATEDNFREQHGGYDILHFSTHGYYLPDRRSGADPLLRSGILFSGANKAWQGKLLPDTIDNGILTAYEISQLDLSGTRLAVLGACETGLGDLSDNEGTMGLQRGFAIAGVHKQMLSLWEVPDLQTAEMMVSFYRHLDSSGDVYKAFTATQDAMRKKYPPYYWAGIVLVE